MAPGDVCPRGSERFGRGQRDVTGAETAIHAGLLSPDYIMEPCRIFGREEKNMYEDMTYETILKSMLAAALAQDADLDSREGSILWLGQAPAAAELAKLYIALDHVLDQSFADLSFLIFCTINPL